MMDRQLKQRVVGAGLLVAFGVIFIPIFLDNGGVESPVPPSMNIPPAPTEDVSQRAPALGDDAVTEMENQADEDLEVPPSRVQSGSGNGAATGSTATPSASGEAPAASDAPEDGSAPVAPTDGSAEMVAPRMVAAPAMAAHGNGTGQGAAPLEPVAEAKSITKAVSEAKPASPAGAPKLDDPKSGAKTSDNKTASKTLDNKVASKPPADKSVDNKSADNRSAAKASDGSTLALAAKPAVPLIGGWNVQLGSFSNDLNAKSLVDKLKAAGYKAYSEPRLEGGVTVFKVRVGPTQGKAEAERIRQRIEGQFDAHGMLVPSR